MAYTIERLEKARRLFPSHTRKYYEFEDKYDLRNRDRPHNTVIGSSWVDNDDDDDYNPRQPRLKRKLPSDHTHRSSRGRSKRARSLSPSLAPLLETDCGAEIQPLPSIPVTLGDLGPSKWDLVWKPQHERDPNQRHFLRPRQRSPDFISLADLRTPPEMTDVPHEAIVPNGCLACQDINLDCSLVLEPLHYPCRNCKDDKCDCLLEPPPLWKRTCESCRLRRPRRCSYNFRDYDHSLPCQECRQHGFKCIAGPAKGLPPLQPCETPDIETINETQLPGPNESPASPGKRVGSGIMSPPERGEYSDSWVNCDEKNNAGIRPSESLESQKEYLGGKVHRVWTEFAHPLKVLHVPPNDGSEPCHWCNNFAYGILGLGVRNPEVLDFGDGKLIELADGHQGEDKETSRMCQACVFKRLEIMKCSHIDIVPLAGFDLPGRQFDTARAYRHLAQAGEALYNPASAAYGEPFNNTRNPWCSLCKEPAFWCCKAPHSLSQSVLIAGYLSYDLGCELVLCDYCAHFTKRFQGNLNKVVQWGRSDPQNGTEYRADVEYILTPLESNYLLRQIENLKQLE
ncbi:hypothetical protein N7462_009717 [Penicillium macrosclerotiorum]|uniref:uncharacterized protein n=1 Tax=Penicillium macrosclerotiorum TaxID=303699 RepID=UPI002548523A|nr:uncharacterized protein N7462_009717 [Penicillium macrosclerotiorum]KAJ5668647.1 hypothetical protein N7462_009717 [Penicillium macrosclerotiorum]